VKIWLAIPVILALPAFAQESPAPAQTEAAGGASAIETGAAADSQPALPEDPNAPLSAEDEPINWVDTSHAYATNQAQALTEWMDAFFGDPEYDAESAESLLRLEFINEWDQDDGTDLNVRLRGKVQLPSVSRRLNLVFAGEDGEAATSEEREDEDLIGLQYKLRDSTLSRFDMTLNYSSSSIVRPGVRYRHEGTYSDEMSYRFIQRLQWDADEGFFTTANYDINQKLNEDNILRWANRVRWGEETNGAEWRTRLALRQRKNPDSRRPVALSYFGSINGDTQPDRLVKNYRLGVLWRRKVYREFLFFEVEPAYNYRRRNLDEDREGAWSIELRMEIALHRDLRRVRESD
jgi:hypothetical protein